MIHMLFSLAILVLMIFALNETWNSNYSPVTKVLWTLAIILFPVVGSLIWFFVGKSKQPSTPQL